jgi:hypothetical protein
MEQKTVSRAVNETREYGIGGIGGSGILSFEQGNVRGQRQMVCLLLADLVE